jgi:hypothetical protein
MNQFQLNASTTACRYRDRSLALRSLSFVLLLGVLLVSQHANSQLLDLGQTIQTLSASSGGTDQAQAAELEHLCFDLLPTLFVNNGELAFPEEGTDPVCADVRASEFAFLSGQNAGLEAIGIYKIRLQDATDLASQVDLGSVPPSAVVFVLSELEVSPSAIADLFGGTLNRPVYYSISSPR